MIKKIIRFFKRQEDLSMYEHNNVLDVIESDFGPMESVLEAGGHNGTDTVKISTKWPSAKIYSFEPVPNLFEELSRKTEEMKNVNVYNLALGRHNGELDLHLSSGRSDGSSSILKPKDHIDFHPDVYFKETITVKSSTLDNWAKENHVDNIDFMWLDMQGAEFEMLDASMIVLPRVKIIFSEVSLIETYEGVPLYDQYRSFMEEKGFTVYKEYLSWEDMGNVLFVRTDYLDGSKD